MAIAKDIPSFAGMYFDAEGTLIVAVTDTFNRSRAESRVRAVLGEHGTARGVFSREHSRVSTRVAARSFITLARYRTALKQRLFSIPGVVSLDVKESANSVVVGVEDTSVERDVRELASTLAIPGQAIIVVQMPRPSTSVRTLASAMGAIQGGWEITSARGTCTLGFSARRASDAMPVFVTNSHCTAVDHAYDGGAFYQAGAFIGSEMLDPGTHTCGAFIADPCRNSDAALVSAAVPIQLGTIARTTSSSGCEDCDAPLTIDEANPTLQITGKRGVIIENEILHKIGRTTGWTYGAVEDACADYEIDGWVRQCSDRVDFSAKKGDSGAPVFSMNTNGTVTLRGINFGLIGGLYNDALMSNIGRVEMDLGSLTVFDSGAPTITITGPTVVPPGATCRWTATISGGIPPYSNTRWTGLASGSGTSITLVARSSGVLDFTATDAMGRLAGATIYVSVEGAPARLCTVA